MHGYLLLCDLKRSSELMVREASAAQYKIQEVLARFNRRRKNKPLINLKLSYGDEIAGLFSTPADAYEVVTALSQALLPNNNFRFVICYGRVGTDSSDITHVGGPVFKQANNSLERLKKRNRYCRWHLQDEQTSLVLDSLVGLTDVLVSQMTHYQYSVYTLLQSGMTQNEAAETLGKYPQSISEAKRSAHVDMLLEAESTIEQLLSTNQWIFIDSQKAMKND